MRVAILGVITACGRLSFDPLGDAGGDAVTYRCAAKDVAVGGGDTCAVDSQGVVWCWGVNVLGQAVPGAGPRALATPTRVELPTTAVRVAVGGQHACAQLDDGSVWCWGDNSAAQLGNGTTAPVTAPVQVQLGTDQAIDLAAGSYHTCIRRVLDSAIMCWGSNGSSELGVASPGQSATPVLVAGTAGTKQIALGHRNGCAVDASDRAVCWGNNNSLQLGFSGGNQWMPTPVAGLGAVSRVAAGGPFSCAIEAGNVRCWGRNDSGQLGTADMMDHFDAQPPVITDAIDVRLWGSGGCAVHGDRSLACWVPPGVTPPSLANVTQLASHYRHSCAVAGGALTCWGTNEDGELGRGVRSSAATPVAIALPGADHVAVGYRHACAHAGGSTWCWGQSANGAVGVASTGPTSTPVELSGGLASVDGMDSDQYSTCEWGGGIAVCWGANGSGELGRGAAGGSALPGAVTVASGIVQMSVGWGFTCARLASSAVCWGDNSYGELGNGTMTSSVTAVQVQNLAAPITDVAAGGGTACAIGNGQLMCWGFNAHGGIGDGTGTSRPTPVMIAIPGGAAHVDVAMDHTCAISTSGALYCWGENGFGQLGVGDTMQRLSPTLVPLPGPAAVVTANRYATCAQLVSGDVLCWGAGENGQNGTGDPIDEHSPRLAPDLSGADAIRRGYIGGCTLRAGVVACWGSSSMLGRDTSANDTPAPPNLTCP